MPRVAPGRDFSGLGVAVWKLAPKFLSFLLSFVFVAIFWVTHHQFFHQLRHSTSGLLWLNNLLLLFLTFLPFPTALLGEYPGNKFSVMFFGLEMICSIGTMVLLRWYATFKAKLLTAEAREAKIRKALVTGTTAVCIYIVAVVVCFLNTTIAISVYVLTPFLYLFTQRKTKD